MNGGNPALLTHLLLASQSPRRREILTWAGIPFQALASHTDETPGKDEPSLALVARLALAKARAIPQPSDGTWILAADTIVALSGCTLGKPDSAAEAREMLLRLRTDMHEVHTGIVLRNARQGHELIRCVTTRVWMRPYSDAEIEQYLASGDPFDKAGGYAIQHPDFHPVDHIERCYANVVGLPLCAVIASLREWDSPFPIDVPQFCLEHFGYHCPGMDEGVRL